MKPPLAAGRWSWYSGFERRNVSGQPLWVHRNTYGQAGKQRPSTSLSSEPTSSTRLWGISKRFVTGVLSQSVALASDMRDELRIMSTRCRDHTVQASSASPERATSMKSPQSSQGATHADGPAERPGIASAEADCGTPYQIGLGRARRLQPRVV